MKKTYDSTPRVDLQNLARLIAHFSLVRIPSYLSYFCICTISLISSQLIGNCEWNIESLNVYSTSTNKNFKIIITESPFFLRIGRNNPQEVGIDRHLEIEYYLIAEKLGIAPKLLGYQIDNGLLISEFILGNSPTEERAQEYEFIEKIIHNLRLLHSSEYEKKEFQIQTVFLRNDFLLKQVENLGFQSHKKMDFWQNMRKSFENDYYQGMQQGICHGDLFRGNLLEDQEGRLFFIDWEYSFYGYVIDDLGKLCSSNWLNDQKVEFLTKTYWGEINPQILCKLRQNIFMQQFNFFLWCHIQASHRPESHLTYLQMAEKVANNLDEIANLLLNR